MAHIAIIHVLDDHTADAIVAGEIGVSSWGTGTRIVGLYNFPNRAELKCSGTCTRKNSGAWSRSPLGFMKCSICGSRNKRLRRWFVEAMFDWFGANLIGDSAPALFRTPDGYGPNRSRDDN